MSCEEQGTGGKKKYTYMKASLVSVFLETANGQKCWMETGLLNNGCLHNERETFHLVDSNSRVLSLSLLLQLLAFVPESPPSDGASLSVASFISKQSSHGNEARRVFFFYFFLFLLILKHSFS